MVSLSKAETGSLYGAVIGLMGFVVAVASVLIFLKASMVADGLYPLFSCMLPLAVGVTLSFGLKAIVQKQYAPNWKYADPGRVNAPHILSA